MIVSIILLFVGIVSGASIVHLFNRQKRKQVIKQRSVVLLERIQNVLKIVTVEGDFSEVITYSKVKHLFFSLIKSQKRALIIVKAKAIIGYDLSKVVINKNEENKVITLTKFPEPEIIGIDTDLEYYDFNDNVFNRYSPEDLTEINKEARITIVEKIPESGLMENAKKQALNVIKSLEILSNDFDWKLEYHELKRSASESKKIENL